MLTSEFDVRPTVYGLLRALVRTVPRRLIVSLLLLLGTTLSEGVGLLILIPLLHTIGLDVQQGTVGEVAAIVSGGLNRLAIEPTLLTILILFLFLNATRALLQRWQSVSNAALAEEFGRRLRRDLYASMAGASWLFFVRTRASSFSHALTAEIDRVSTAVTYLLTLVVTAVVTLVYLGLALRLSVPVTLLVFSCGVMLMLALRRGSRVAYSLGEENTEATGALFSAADEYVGGMKVAKAYGAVERQVRAFESLSDRIAAARVRARASFANTRMFHDVGTVALLSIVVFFAVERAALPAGGLILLIFLFARMLPRIAQVQQYYQYLCNLLPALDTIAQLQAECIRSAEPVAVREDTVTLRHHLRLQGVRFGYDHGALPLFDELDLEIRAGATTAIVGPSGAGKSTIADLVLGLLQPWQGSILTDGEPVTPERMHSWRQQIAYVPQDTFLFHETIRANLLWASPTANEEEIWTALELASAGEFVRRLPHGLDTPVGDRGVRLSGGEKQRLALARALLRKPSLLILDEATSALDMENELRIQRAVEELHGRISILIITHRLSTIRGADTIYFLEDGRVVEQGNWQELIGTATSRLRAVHEAATR
jgi:ATP-binding cassette, subfamily C, bacterial